jgi:hypothetical protein
MFLIVSAAITILEGGKRLSLIPSIRMGDDYDPSILAADKMESPRSHV